MSSAEIIALDRAEIGLEPWSWPFAAERRADIAGHFAALQRRRARVWNGRVLLLKSCAIEGRCLRGACFATDYASFCAWRDWDCPDRGVFNVFAAAAVCASDGAFLVGEMAASTSNAGRLYFPCGTPDPDDLDADGRLDLIGSLGRELLEETGLDFNELAAESGWTLVRDGCYLALLKRAVAVQSADELRARISNHLASERHPELAGIRFLRSPADFTATMPRFVTAFLADVWS